MNKILKIFLIIVFGLSIVQCTNDESTPTEVVLNDYTEQKNIDEAKIITYLKMHQLNPPTANQDVSFTNLKTSMGTESMWVKNLVTPSNPNPQYPLTTRVCTANNISYTIYYIKLQQGGSSTPDSKRPCNIDGVFTAYKGRLMDDFVPKGTTVGAVTTTVDTGGASDSDVGTVFETNDNPTDFFNLDFVIRGWSEIFPLFNSGSHTANPNGTNSYSDFGAGVMFLPSGLAYFSNSRGLIPSYSPLIFNFKLYEVRRNDHDFDGIDDFDEDLPESIDPANTTGPKIKDNYIYANGSNSPSGKATDDTDGDGASDAYDQDDDGDKYPTKSECKRPLSTIYDSNGVLTNTGYYPYQSKFTIDLPSTPYDDTQGVPDCSNNTSSLTRKRRYLDASCSQ